MRMIFQSGEGLAKRVPCRSDTLEELVSFQVIQNGVAGSTGHRMRLIGKAMHESGGAFLKGFRDGRSDPDRAQKRLAAGDSLPGENNVPFHPPLAPPKPPSPPPPARPPPPAPPHDSARPP